MVSAYLVKGVRTTLFVHKTSLKKIISISIEGCDKELCNQFESKNKCISESESKWNCHIENAFPKYVRFSLILEDNRSLNTKLVFTNGETALDNFTMTIKENDVLLESLKRML